MGYQFQVMAGLCPGGMSNCTLYGGVNRHRGGGGGAGRPLGGQSQLLGKIQFNSIVIYSRAEYKQRTYDIHNQH
jgi:hypothetical protein